MSTPATVQPTRPDEVVRNTLAVVSVGILAMASFIILRPFLAALVWATMIVIATWPLMIAIQRRLRGRRTLATAVMTVLLLTVLFVPLWMAIKTIASNASSVTAAVQSVLVSEIPSAPAWLKQIPFAGATMAKRWDELKAADRQELLGYVTPYIRGTFSWFVSQASSVGMLFVHFFLTVVLSAVLYVKGEGAAAMVLRFSKRLAGDLGAAAVTLAAQAVRAVALGIVVTALVQSAVAGFGLFVAGIPYAALLTALIFMLGVAQIGPLPVMVPTVIWLYWSGYTGWGTGMLLWTLVVGGLDNFLRPWLIRRGADIPLLLVFGGVMGGLLSFGIIGLFIGPVTLAVTYTLVNEWIDQGIVKEAQAIAGIPPSAEIEQGPVG